MVRDNFRKKEISILAILKRFNPRLPEPFFVTRLPKGVVTTPH